MIINNNTPITLSMFATHAMTPIVSGPTPVRAREPIALPPLCDIFSPAELLPSIVRPQTPIPYEPLENCSRKLPLPRGLHSRGVSFQAVFNIIPSGEPLVSPRKCIPTKRAPFCSQRTQSKKRCLTDAGEETSAPKVHRSKRVRLTDVDLSLDENKHIRPFFSPAKMAAQSILRSKHGELSLEDIFEWLETHYAFIRHEPKKKNSWIYRVPAEMKRMAWLFEQVPGPVHSVWRIRAECRAPMRMEAFKQGQLPSQLKLLGNSPWKVSLPCSSRCVRLIILAAALRSSIAVIISMSGSQ